MKVVIVGGGFGGVRLAQNLANREGADITLISDRTAFEYHAALYRTATGRSVLETVIRLDEIFQKAENVEVIQDKVVKLDAQKKQVAGESGSHYKYDKLVLALGNVTNYYGIKGLPEHSYGIKSINEALRLRRHLHDELTSNKKPDLNYVVVGAGPTGVELAGELVSYLRQIRDRHGLVQRRFQVSLIEAAPRILPTLSEVVSRKVSKRLAKLGVKIYTSTAVKAETADKIQLPTGNLRTHTVVWTAGVGNNPFFAEQGRLFELDKRGRVVLDAQQQAAQDVYVIGDSASTKWSGLAQTAIYDADYVANQLKHPDKATKTYAAPAPVACIPVGHGWCAVEIGSRRLYGYSGWLLRRYLDLKLLSKLMSPSRAFSAWWAGNKVEENCPVCAGREA